MILYKATITLILVVIFTGLSFCQRSKKLITIGLTYQPFIYWGFNKGESSTQKQKVIKPRGFNGVSFGIFGKYQILENVSLRAEISYTNQNQKYKFSSYSGTNGDNVTIYAYEDDRINSFEIIKIPLFFEFNQEIIYDTGFKISGFIGPQLSYLNAHKIELFQHPDITVFNEEGAPIGVKFLEDSTFNYIRYSKKFKYQEEYYSTGSLVQKEEVKPKAFHDFTIGAVGGIELSKSLFDFLFISIGGRFEYDFTNMEKVGAEGVSYIATNDLMGAKRPPSHHVRAGFNFSVGYRF